MVTISPARLSLGRSPRLVARSQAFRRSCLISLTSRSVPPLIRMNALSINSTCRSRHPPRRGVRARGRLGELPYLGRMPTMIRLMVNRTPTELARGFLTDAEVYLRAAQKLDQSADGLASSPQYYLACHLEEMDLCLPNPIDQNPWAHWRSPMDMMRQGWSTSLFHAAQQWSTRSS